MASERSRKPATYLRSVLGDGTYRYIAQGLRVVRSLTHPHYEEEVEALPLFIRPGMVCFDIGANYGHYSRLLSPLVGRGGRVFAFEPSSVTCAGLRFTRRALGWRNVHIEQCALSDAPGELPLHIPIKEHGGLGIALAHLGQSLNRATITEMVPVKTMDDFAAAHNVARCDFIKCDVEGAELLVLKGGAKTLARFKPALLLEIDSSYLSRHGHSVADIEAMLRGLGYGFSVWEKGRFEQRPGLTDKRNNFAFCTL